MEAFLQKVAKWILSSDKQELQDFMVVLPSKRAGLFFKRHLTKLLSSPTWLPQVCTINDLILEYTEEICMDDTSALFELYKIYLSFEGKEADSFDKFSAWGTIMLSDFQEIDRYMVPVKDLYRNLQSIKEIEGWSFHQEELSLGQQQYLKFWDQMGSFYEKWQESIRENGMISSGSAYRKLAENVTELSAKLSNKTVVFAGFNALSTAEEIIFRSLENSGIAKIFWDVDAYYTEDKEHEAGLFYRRYRKNWKSDSFTDLPNQLLTQKKEIQFIGVPNGVGQTKVAGDLLRTIQKEEPDLTNTAVVLAAESLLMPMLHSLPESIEAVNVTMGLPLSETILSSLFTAILSLHENGKWSQLPTGVYHYKDVLKILQHPIIKDYTGLNKQSQLIKTFIDQVQSSNKVFIDQQYFTDKTDQQIPEISALLRPWKKYPVDPMETFTQMVQNLKSVFLKEESKSLIGEYLFEFSKMLTVLKELFEKYPFIKHLPAFRKVFLRNVSKTSLSFFGEPLQGLQLMGMLESRTLDFKNLILLSVNEQILPKAKMDHSFIPHDLKRLFGLPTYKEREAIFAHHFFRLIQRAEKVTCLYNSQSEGLNAGEKSRYLLQIEHELTRLNPAIKLTQKTYSGSMPSHQDEKLTVEKDDFVFHRLDDLLAYGLSPSAINTYLDNPLEFYFKYILGIKENEEVEEVIEISSFGTFVHEVLEELYKEFEDCKKQLLVEDIHQMESKVEEAMERAFSQRFEKAEFKQGKNYLIFSIAKNYVKRFLTQEKAFLKKCKEPVYVWALEKRMKFGMEVLITSTGEKKKVHFTGSADRIDIVGNKYRIIDYKTGATSTSDLGLSGDVVERLFKGDKPKALQLLTYGWLFHQLQPDVQDFTSGIVSLKKLSSGLMNLKIDKSDEINANAFEQFEKFASQLINELFDLEVPFSKPDSAKYGVFTDEL